MRNALAKILRIYMLILSVIIFCMIPKTFADASEKSNYSLQPQQNEVTMYIGDQLWQSIILNHAGEYTDAARKESQKILDAIEWKTSKPDVVGFFDTTSTDLETGETIYHTKKRVQGESSVNLIAKSEGTAVITASSKLLNSSVKFKVNVKYAELTNDIGVFYENNNYNMVMKGNARSVEFTSSNKNIATVDKTTGEVTAKKQGTTTISCKADDGKIYTYDMVVEKQGLSYTTLTSYYFTGFREGCYTEFPLVAEGIQVKSWKSSNPKICKLETHGRLAILQTTGTGSCNITCTAKDGKKYVCKLTVKGGTEWSGLGGYTPTLSELKKHGYYNDINSIKDYGDMIVAIYDYANEIQFENGNKRMETYPDDIIRQKLNQRFGYDIKSCGGDFIQATLDHSKKCARIWVVCYYKE